MPLWPSQRDFNLLTIDRFETVLCRISHLYREKIKGLGKNYSNRNLRFSQRCYWRFVIFGMFRCVLAGKYGRFEETAHLRNIWAMHQATRHHVPEGMNLHPHDQFVTVKIPQNNTFEGGLNHYLLTWRIWWAPNNASRGQMGFSSAFKGLNQTQYVRRESILLPMLFHPHYLLHV
jgi:hypothetical protein